MVRVSAPAKAHLIGEHSVVGGEPAIITAVGLRTTVNVETSGYSASYSDRRFDSYNKWWNLADLAATVDRYRELWGQCAERKNFSELASWAKENNFENYKRLLLAIPLTSFRCGQGISVDISSEAPSGSGVGSSASLAVAILKGTAELIAENPTREQDN